MIQSSKEQIKLISEENDSLKKKLKIIEVYFEETENKLRSAIDMVYNPAYFSPTNVEDIKRPDREHLIALLEIEAKLQIE